MRHELRHELRQRRALAPVLADDDALLRGGHGAQEGDGLGVRIRVAERAADVDLAQGERRDGHVRRARAHAHEHDARPRGGGVHAHLHGALCARALEDDVEPVGLGEVREQLRGGGLCLGEDLVCGAGCWCGVGLGRAVDGAAGVGGGPLGGGGGRGGEAEDVVGKGVPPGELEALGVDVDGDDAAGAAVARECAGKEADGADAKDEDGLVGDGSELDAAGGVYEDGEGLREGGELEGDVVGERVEDVGGVVDACLERAVDVGEAGGRRAEAHVLAEVVAARLAEGAGAAADARLDGDALPDLEQVVGVAGDGGDDAGGLVAEDEGGAHGKVAVAAVGVVMQVGPAEAGGDDGDLGEAVRRGPEETVLELDVAGAVEHGGGGGDWGHFWACREAKVSPPAPFIMPPARPHPASPRSARSPAQARICDRDPRADLRTPLSAARR